MKNRWRRVVASPLPKRIFEIRPIKWLLENGAAVIRRCGVPTAYRPERTLSGIEAVIDEDHCSELLARELEVDLFIVATDAEAVFVDWRKPAARAILLPPIVSPALNFMEA